MGHVWVPDAPDATGERGAMHVEYPLVVRCGSGRPPRMVQRRFRDFDRLYEKLARHAGISTLERLSSAGRSVLPPLPRGGIGGERERKGYLVKDRSPEFAAARCVVEEAHQHHFLTRPYLDALVPVPRDPQTRNEARFQYELALNQNVILIQFETVPSKSTDVWSIFLKRVFKS